MKSRTTHSFAVIGLHDLFNTDEIRTYFNSPLQVCERILNKKYENFVDWKIDFNCFYVKGEDVKVFKGFKPYVKDKEKQITIHIPIPSKEEGISWGFDGKNAYEINVSPRNYKSIFIDFTQSNSLMEHIIKCIKMGIENSFKEGFTLMGEKIQIKEDVFNQLSN